MLDQRPCGGNKQDTIICVSKTLRTRSGRRRVGDNELDKPTKRMARPLQQSHPNSQPMNTPSPQVLAKRATPQPNYQHNAHPPSKSAPQFQQLNISTLTWHMQHNNGSIGTRKLYDMQWIVRRGLIGECWNPMKERLCLKKGTWYRYTETTLHNQLAPDTN